MPPPSALPSSIRSGVTPSWSQAKRRPVRPRPDWISSAISSTFASVQSARAPLEVAVGRDDHAGLALDRLDQERDRVVVERRLERLEVAERDALEAGRERPEAGRVATGSSENETIVVVRPWKLPRQTTIFARSGRDPLDLVAPLPGRLDRGLDRLGAGVHRQHPLRASRARRGPAELAEPVVAEGAAGQRQPVELLAGGRDEPRVAVAEVERRVGGERVEVAAPVDVLDPGALAAADDHRQRGRSCGRRIRSSRPGGIGDLLTVGRYLALMETVESQDRVEARPTSSRPASASAAASSSPPSRAGARCGRSTTRSRGGSPRDRRCGAPSTGWSTSHPSAAARASSAPTSSPTCAAAGSPAGRSGASALGLALALANRIAGQALHRRLLAGSGDALRPRPLGPGDRRDARPARRGRRPRRGGRRLRRPLHRRARGARCVRPRRRERPPTAIRRAPISPSSPRR